MRKKVKIIDYQLSNLFSVKHACDFVGLDAEITSDPNKIFDADGIILPGVGAFGDAMKNLRKNRLDSAIIDFVKKGKPFMGICLGMQLIFSESEEFGIYKGLDLIKGKIMKIPARIGDNQIKVPQIGWNKIYMVKNRWKNTYLKDLGNNQFMYFVHSYFVLPRYSKQILANTKYEGFEYTSAVLKDNIFAVQFHPEKSGDRGLSIYRNFANKL